MKNLRLKDQEFSEQGTDNFWYDLFDGGYIKPETFLEDESAKKVKEAILVLEEYKQLLMDKDNPIIYDL